MSSDAVRLHELEIFFAALSDDDRLRIAGILAQRPATFAHIAEASGIAPPAIQRHLRLLDAEGIVAATDGSPPHYVINSKHLREQRARLLSRTMSERGGDDAMDAHLRTLNAFLDGERLTAIPASLNKRLVVLEWLVNHFDEETHYPEREVNEVIKRHHPDASALRRELVDNGFMRRENGVYWRIR